MFALITATAAEQPGKGDYAIGVRYGNISADSDFDDREGLYIAEAEFFLEGGTSFGLGIGRPEGDTDPGFNLFVGKNWGPAFLRGSVSYLNFEADDATTAGLGFGLSFIPKPHFRIVAMIEAAYVLSHLDLVDNFDTASGPSLESCSNSNSSWCDEPPPPPPPMDPDPESVDFTYSAGIGFAWFD